MSRTSVVLSLVSVVVIAALGILLTLAKSDLKTLESDNKVLQSDNTLQGQAIANQAFNFNRFNMIAETTSRNNSLIDAGTENTVIEYREILRREKTCDLPVPADISDGLLEYANSLRASAMHTDTSGTAETDNRPVTTKRLTYCQSVPWVRLLLAEAEKANNQLAGIRQIEKTRASNQSGFYWRKVNE